MTKVMTKHHCNSGVSGGAKVLCKLSVPGRPTNLNNSRARPIALAVGADGGWGTSFFLSPSLRNGPI